MYTALLLLAVAGVCCGEMKTRMRMATCDMETNKDIGKLTDRVSGKVTFTEESGVVRVSIQLDGFNTTDEHMEHGFHVHANSDIEESCSGAAGHYNPGKQQHGAPTDTVRHVGDLGNIEEDAEGRVSMNMTDSVIKLHGEHSIIGKAVVVHEKADDLGKGGDDGSKKTGNAGGRLACCIIEESDDKGTSEGSTWRANSVLTSVLMIVLVTLWQ